MCFFIFYLTQRRQVFTRNPKIFPLAGAEWWKNVETFSPRQGANDGWGKAAAFRSRGVCYLSGCHLVAVGVHGGQDVDARVMNQPHDPLVSGPVLLTEELGELDEQLPAQHLVAVHVAHVLELRLHWGRKWRGVGGEGRGKGRRRRTWGQEATQSCQAWHLKWLPEHVHAYILHECMETEGNQ